MQRFQRELHALGSTVLLTIVTTKDDHFATQLLDELSQQIIAFEERFSRFLTGSELTKFNNAAGEHTTISPAFRRLLVIAQGMAHETNGLYNPFVLPALQRAGYTGSWPEPDTAAATDFSNRHIVPIDELTIGDAWARIPAHTAVDFGGIGKGYLLDELADYLKQKNLQGYWLSLGGDIICQGNDSNEQPWQIGIQDAHDPARVIRTVTNEDGTLLAIATSGVTKRRGIKAGKPWHHLIDPRTGEPAATNMLTATVVAAHATAADIYAKTSLIAGVDQAREYAARGAIRSFILQFADRTKIMDA